MSTGPRPRRGGPVPAARPAGVRAARRRGAGGAGRAARRHRLDVRPAVALGRRLLLPDRRQRLLRRHPGRPALRLGRLLRGRLADLAQPVDHHATASSSAARRWPTPPTPGPRCCCAGSRPGHPGPGPGPAGSAGRLRAAQDDPAQARGHRLDRPQRAAAPALVRRRAGAGSGTDGGLELTWTWPPASSTTSSWRCPASRWPADPVDGPGSAGKPPGPPGRPPSRPGHQPGAPRVPAQLRRAGRA